jgi:osmotically-inducible protein OsmY
MIDDVIVEPDPRQPNGGSPPQDTPDGGITSDETAADDMTERVRDALLADSLGNGYVDELRIKTAGSVAILEGVVEDLDVMDHLIGVVAQVPGISEVRDRLTLPGSASGSGRDIRAED